MCIAEFSDCRLFANGIFSNRKAELAVKAVAFIMYN